MHAEQRRELHALKQPLLHHMPRTDHGLLGGLEEEENIARDLLAALCQQLRRAEQHRRVDVVAAGVHDALVHAGKRKAGLLMDGQRVDIGAEGDALTGAFGAVDQADDGGGQRLLNLVGAQTDRRAGPPAAQKRRRSGRKPQLHRLKSQRGQMPLHQLRRLKFAVRELRMAVNLRADATQERVQFSALALVHRNIHRNPPRLGMFFRVLIVCRPSRFVNVCPPYFYNMACSPCQPRV